MLIDSVWRKSYQTWHNVSLSKLYRKDKDSLHKLGFESCVFWCFLVFFNRSAYYRVYNRPIPGPVTCDWVCYDMKCAHLFWHYWSIWLVTHLNHEHAYIVESFDPDTFLFDNGQLEEFLLFFIEEYYLICFASDTWIMGIGLADGIIQVISLSCLFLYHLVSSSAYIIMIIIRSNCDSLSNLQCMHFRKIWQIWDKRCILCKLLSQW